MDFMVGPERLELSYSRLRAVHSNPLNYKPINKLVVGVGSAPTSSGLQPDAFTSLAYQPRYIADIPS